MNYKILKSNDAVNVIKVDGEIIQLSASISIEDYLKCKSESSIKTNGYESADDIKPKLSKAKRQHEIAEE